MKPQNTRERESKSCGAGVSKRSFTPRHPEKNVSRHFYSGSRKANIQQNICVLEKELNSCFRRNDKKKAGFTLIEISIVLVIIGLLVGGVLVGQTLIEAATLRKDFALTEKYDAAVNTFSLKYDDLPGDINNPTQFGFNANTNGDGNGKIQLISGAGGPTIISSLSFTNRAEWFFVNHHLGTAGLVELSGNYDTAAITDIRAGIYYPKIQTSSGGGHDESGGVPPGMILSFEENNRVQGHFYRFGAVPYPWGSTSYLTFLGGFHPTKAKQIDIKFDDGMPTTGRVQIGPVSGQCAEDIYDTANGCAHGGIGLSSDWFHCALLSTNDYDTDYNLRSCSLRVKASF